MRAALLRTRLLGALGLPLAAGCSSPPSAGPTDPGSPASSAPARVRTSSTDEQDLFTDVSPPLKAAWYPTYRPGACKHDMVATDHTLACQEAAHAVAGDGQCSSPAWCPDEEAKALGCPLTVGRQGTHRFLEPISTRLERATRATACCYGDAPICQYQAVPGRPLTVGGARVAARARRAESGW